jgi:hypothetical protein
MLRTVLLILSFVLYAVGCTADGGCLSEKADNYNDTALFDNGSCIFTVGEEKNCTNSYLSDQWCYGIHDLQYKTAYYVIEEREGYLCAITPDNGVLDMSALNTNNKSVIIGNAAFQNCGLTSIVWHEATVAIGTYAFGRNRLTSLTIPSSVTSIAANAFSNNRLTSLTIPSSVTSIGTYAFRSNQLHSLTIPSSVTSIGAYAFYDNQQKGILTIPSSVTSIGTYAFGDNPDIELSLPVGSWEELATNPLYHTLPIEIVDAGRPIKGCRAMNPLVTVDLCPLGCTDQNYQEYNASAVLNDESCATLDLSRQGCKALKSAYQTKSTRLLLC